MPAKIEGGMGPKLPGGARLAEVGDTESRCSPNPWAGGGEIDLAGSEPLFEMAGDVPGREDGLVDTVG
jgi:hypothetical protein